MVVGMVRFNNYFADDGGFEIALLDLLSEMDQSFVELDKIFNIIVASIDQ